MIEVIYKKEESESKENEEILNFPKNIRQIGVSKDDYKIYIEDYVYTFLKRAAHYCENSKENISQVMVLLGEIKWKNQTTCVFVTGALLVENEELSQEYLDFNDSIWKDINQNKERYFDDKEIVGWFFVQSQIDLQVTEYFTKIHMKYFGGEKLLIIMSSLDKEEAIYRNQNGVLLRERGYYIFYEKNEKMQRYMLDKKQLFDFEKTETIDDNAVKKIRKIVKEKQAEEETSALSYIVTACLAAAVLFVGVNFYKNYMEMQKVQKKAEQVSSIARSNISEKTNMEEKDSTEIDKYEITIFPEELETPTPEPTVLPTASPMPTITPKVTPDILRKSVANQNQMLEGIKQDTNYNTYVIRPGDTLYEISISKYGSVDMLQKICELNEIDEREVIYPGQVIVLP